MHYVQSYVIPAENGKIFLLLSTPKSELNATLSHTRVILFLIFISTALLAIIFAIYRLNILVTKPLYALTHRAKDVEKGNYPVFPVDISSSDMELLGNVLTQRLWTESP